MRRHQYYAINWVQEAEMIDPAPINNKRWLIFGDRGEIENSLLNHFDSQEIFYTLITRGREYRKIKNNHYVIRENMATDRKQLIADLGEEQYDIILYLWGMGESVVDNDLHFNKVIGQCMPLINLVEALTQGNADQEVILGIVTRDSQCVIKGDSGTGLYAAPLWSLGQLIENEVPIIKSKLIDFDKAYEVSDVDLLVAEIISKTQDRNVAYRLGKRFVQKLNHADIDNYPQNKETKIISTQYPVSLSLKVPGQIDSLAFEECSRLAPSTGEVEIQVEATALNFKDLLKIYGHINAKAIEGTFFGETLGMEIAGKIVSVGEGVDNFKVGDEVVTPISGSFRSYATVSDTYLMPLPEKLRKEEALNYIGYFAAYYGLIDIAQLKKGEKVLIHSATGGLGLAAVQIAQWVGAEIFATAGNDEKRKYLKDLGINNVMDSRSLDFTEKIRKITENKGVDVILNALSGDSFYQSFSLLAPYGRFIEVGKKDIADNNALLLSAFNRNLTFASVDVDRMLKERPEIITRLSKDINRGFEEGYFWALPTKIFPASEVVEAFRYMSQSKHIGKIVVTMQDQEVPALTIAHKREILRKDGTYLVTGGTRGFGLEVAKWLSKKGVDQLALISRSGAVTEEAKAAITEIEMEGTSVKVADVDITEGLQVKQLFEDINSGMPPLRGIFHSAMVLDDGYLKDLDEHRLRKVMAPKVAGILNLHENTKKLNLDYFVSFSSVSSLIGNTGQGNYVAANAFLDAFAHYRRARNLPALTINWGVMEETGVVARNADIARHLNNIGIRGISTDQALEALEKLLDENPIQMGVFNIDWEQWAMAYPHGADSSRYSALIESDLAGYNSQKTEKYKCMVEELSNLGSGERQKRFETLISEQLVTVMHIPADKIDHHQSFKNLGIDSLMTLEIRLAFKSNLGIEISSVDLLTESSISQLATQLLDKIVAIPVMDEALI